MIKDVFINEKANLYQKIESFETMRELSKKSNSKDDFKIEVVGDLLCLTIGEVEMRHIFTENEDTAEIEKIKKIILDENDVYQELDPSKNIPLLEENIQLAFTYNVKDQDISVDPQESYYEYSYLNI